MCAVGAVPALHQPGRGRRGERGGGRLPHGRAAAERRPGGLPDTLLAPRRLHRHGDGLLRLHAAVQEMHHRVSGDCRITCDLFLLTHVCTRIHTHIHTHTLSLCEGDLAEIEMTQNKMQRFISPVCVCESLCDLKWDTAICC